MQVSPTSLADVLAHGFDTVIDVRSPGEFAEDHLPGAINLPVLNDEERAHVGTIYVQEDPFLARKIGAALVARNAARHIEQSLADHGGGWRPLVYCWRGGQRSGSFAAILAQIGWRVGVLDGGYRTWRKLVNAALYEKPVPHRMVLLDGNTGTAKTDLLARLEARGVQVIDLEGLANHRGSALGARGEQPSQKGFESALAAELVRLDPDKPTVLEAESSKIGRINLPPALFAAMKEAPRVEVTASLADRAAYLVEDYGDVVRDGASVRARLDKLVRLQGQQTVEAWKARADAGDYVSLAADLIERHYDPRYAKVRERVGGRIVQAVAAEDLTPDGRERLADRLLAVVSAL